MTAGAAECSLPWCALRTLDPSGRCRHHRFGGSGANASTLVPPSFEVPGPVDFGGSRGSSSRTEWWGPEGCPWREGSPTVVVYNRSNVVTGEEWLIDGTWGRADPEAGPVERYFSEDGSEVLTERWRKNGFYHRVGGPAIMEYGERTFYEDGSLHRVDGPAIERRARNTSFDPIWAIRGKVVGPLVYLDLTDRPLSRWVLLEAFELYRVERDASDGLLDLERLTEALAGGAPFEWASAYARGETS